MRNPVLRDAMLSSPAAIATLAVATLLLVSLLAVRGSAAPDHGDATRPAAGGQPARTWAFRGGGWGHGVGMSQYGALGMAQRKRTAAQIISFYYGGARIASASHPETIRVGMLQGRTEISVRAGRVPGTPAGGRLRVTVVDPVSGGPVARAFPQGVDLRVVPDAGGLSVLAGGERVLGPGKPGAAVRMDYARETPAPVLVTLPQAGKTLRWGRLEVAAVGLGSATRLRAVATMGWSSYLRGLAEVPRLWPVEAQRAQAITARSYALATVRAAGQHRGAASPTGCDCGVYADTRDQHFLGWAQERGPGAERWIDVVAATKGQVVVYQGRTLVKAFYSSSNGGHTAGAEIWGGPQQPYYPAKRDTDDAAGGRNPFHTWTERRGEAAVSSAFADLRVGDVIEIDAVTKDRSGRLKTVLVAGTRGAALISGNVLQRRLKLRSTRLLSITPPPPAPEDPDPEDPEPEDPDPEDPDPEDPDPEDSEPGDPDPGDDGPGRSDPEDAGAEGPWAPHLDRTRPDRRHPTPSIGPPAVPSPPDR